MRIGIVSGWHERGQAYVSRAYRDILRPQHEVFVYARGGELFAKGDPNWDGPDIHWGYRLENCRINKRDFFRWMDAHRIETLFFNEQKYMDIILALRRERPEIKVGSYIDYYREDTLEHFLLYDFLICNTLRHSSVFTFHPQSHYIPWGTDTALFSPRASASGSEICFFHSAGFSSRKGTAMLLDVFCQSDLPSRSRLVIHTQAPIPLWNDTIKQLLSEDRLEIIHQTIPAPGLYHLGDVYVYPTVLEGLGLTIYEALSCGLPVITTDEAPMNEVVDNQIGCLVKVKKRHARADGYYWPVAVVDPDHLYQSMLHFISNPEALAEARRAARDRAVECLEWRTRKSIILDVFENSRLTSPDLSRFPDQILPPGNNRSLARHLFNTLPDTLIHWVNVRRGL